MELEMHGHRPENPTGFSRSLSESELRRRKESGMEHGYAVPFRDTRNRKEIRREMHGEGLMGKKIRHPLALQHQFPLSLSRRRYLGPVSGLSHHSVPCGGSKEQQRGGQDDERNNREEDSRSRKGVPPAVSRKKLSVLVVRDTLTGGGAERSDSGSEGEGRGELERVRAQRCKGGDCGREGSVSLDPGWLGVSRGAEKENTTVQSNTSERNFASPSRAEGRMVMEERGSSRSVQNYSSTQLPRVSPLVKKGQSTKKRGKASGLGMEKKRRNKRKKEAGELVQS